MQGPVQRRLHLVTVHADAPAGVRAELRTVT